MRSVLLVLSTLILLAAGFTTYWVMQPTVVSEGVDAGPTTKHAAQKVDPSESTYSVRGGKGVWLKQFDDQRRRTSQFRADDFNPQKDGSVKVTNPEAQFFLKNGQWIQVTGLTGDVYFSGLPQGATDPFSGATGGHTDATPSRGTLQHVHLKLFETAEDTVPTLDMDMNNAAFNNETFRIFTEGYTDDAGKQIDADQVKVTVRGKYEFDGRGLTIRWNDRDRRLELLEIAHGERLVVKDPGAMGAKVPGGNSAAEKGSTGAGEKRAAVAPDAFEAPDPMFALASADPTAGAAVATDSNSKKNSTLYEIWFYDNVQVVQEEKTLATGSVIECYFATKESSSSSTTAPTTQPTQQTPSTSPNSSTKDSGNPTQPQRQQSPQTQEQPDTKAAQTQPTTQPATRPAERPQPITVYWSGKLRIIPAIKPPPVKVNPGESAVQMRGEPVVITRDNVQIKCPSFIYNSSDGTVQLLHSDAFPQVEIAQFTTPERTGKPDLTLVTEKVDYAAPTGTAIMFGKSRAVFPADQSGKPDSLATAVWTEEGVAHFVGTGNDTVIQALDLHGNVDVQHPQVQLKSQRLTMAFEPPTPKAARKPTTQPGKTPNSGQPVAREIVADGTVHCVLEDENGASREIHGDHLEIATAKDAEEKMYPRTVNARGHVHAKESGREITSDTLAIQLLPAPPKKPDVKTPVVASATTTDSSTTSAVQLEKMVATSNVRATSADGDVANGDLLIVTSTPDGKPNVVLTGKPAKVVNAKGTILTSAKLLIPKPNEAQAIGAGTLHSLVEESDTNAVPNPNSKNPPRFMDVAWTESAIMDGKLTENQVQVVGQVSAKVPEADGTINTAHADRMLLSLVDKPPDPTAVTRPTTKPSKSAKDDKDGAIATTDVDVMKNKQVSRILLNKDALVDSRFSAPDGSVLREMRIDSSLISYDLLKQHLIVPRPGRMLVRDHTPPGPKPAGNADSGGLNTQRGATAFQWADSLDYNGTEQRAVMKGDVFTAYKPDDTKELPVRMRGDQVIVLFEEKPAVAGAKPAVPPKPQPPQNAMTPKGPKLQPRSVRAEGNVVVVRGTDELTAPRLTYDPNTHWIRAIAVDRTPAVFSSGGNATSGQEFQWNTDTWKIRVIDASGRGTGRGTAR